MDRDLTHPAIDDLRRTAKRRLPHFAFEYLDSATGSEMGHRRNRLALDKLGFLPGVMKGPTAPDFTTDFLGRSYALPLIIAPIGMAGAVWPGAEAMLAEAGARLRIPVCQSNVAAATPEETGPLTGGMGWFQHYPVKDERVRVDMLQRMKAAGFETLVVTVDVPAESRRERQRRAHLDMPPRLTPAMIWQAATSPAWTWALARNGRPRMSFCLDYVDGHGRTAMEHAGKLLRGYPDRADIRHLRALWDGPMIVKGVEREDDATWLVSEGVDAIWVSTHGGRQFEGGPAAIDRLPVIRAAVGPDVPLIFDSGVNGGLDVLRGLALGADMVALGRAWMFALAALGPAGLDHLAHILAADMTTNMAQIGVKRTQDLAAEMIAVDPA